MIRRIADRFLIAFFNFSVDVGSPFRPVHNELYRENDIPLMTKVYWMDEDGNEQYYVKRFL